MAKGKNKNELYFYLSEKQIRKILDSLQEFEKYNKENEFDIEISFKIDLKVFH